MDDIYKTRKTLLLRVKDQYNDDAWAEFSEVYQNYIYTIIRRMNIVRGDAEDIHQKVLVKLWEALPSLDLDQTERFRNFLSTVTRNCVMDFMRQRKRQLAREAKSDAVHDYLDDIRLPEIDEIVEREWELFITNRAYQKISEDYSEQFVLILKMFIEGKDMKEAEQITGLNTKQVYNIRFRMKKRFVEEVKALREELG
jgi:RNA polymerase sigma factor (sigma-70 family)